MEVFKKLGYALFGVVAIADITLLATDLNRFRFFTKPLLLPLLLALILVQSAGQRHPVSKFLLIVAFIAGTVGDVFMLADVFTPGNFVAGMVAFLIMQVFYCLYFFRMHGLKTEFLLVNFFVLLLLAGYSVTLVGILYEKLGSLVTPVILYTAAITLMFFSAINVYHSKRAQKLAIRNFIPGAAFLVMSDSILAFNKFYLKEDLFEVSVMVTYILGQLFLTLGFVKHLKSGRRGGKRRRSRSLEGEDEAMPAL